MTPPVPIHDYDGLIVAKLRGPDDLYAAYRLRAETVNIARAEIDALAGFCSDYASKVLAPNPLKRLSVDSMFSLANALGCDLFLVENPELVKLTMRARRRHAEMAKHAAVVHVLLSKRFMRKIARKGGAKSRSKMSRRHASMLGRRAARARWRKVKATRQYVGVTACPR